MSAIELWKLCSEYSIVQAALLISGYDPAEYQHRVENNGSNYRLKGYDAVKTALYNAVASGLLEPIHLVKLKYDFEDTERVDVHETMISVYDLDEFLRLRGYDCEYFKRSGHDAATPVSGKNRYYAPKLEAANRAWEAVTNDPARLAGKSPKQALQIWLTDHADDFGLRNEDGTLNKQGIEDICKVANWKPGGGATPTPTYQVLAQPSALRRLPAPASPATTGPRETFSADLDDEIPF